MFGQKFFPYSTLQELNLDWILTKVKNILRFVPDDGAVGQILRRTKDGAEWSNEQGGGGGAVDSVNGQTGTVVLTASDVGALPDSYTAPVTSVNTKTGAVVLDKTDVGLGNVANVAQYSASNPPPYPVTSVNTKTGAVVLDKTDIGLGNVANVAQYSASNPPPYPVTSVNGQTGDVVVGSLTRTLLWTNPSTNLGATTINLDMSGYDYIEIECTETGNYPQRSYFVKCEIGTSTTPAQETLTTFYFNRDLSGYAALGVMSRYADIYSDRIVFTSGDMLYDGAYYKNWDGRAVPYKIWGIKY